MAWPEPGRSLSYRLVHEGEADLWSREPPVAAASFEASGETSRPGSGASQDAVSSFIIHILGLRNSWLPPEQKSF